MGEAKSYAERLFDFVEIGPLPIGEAERAITVPAEEEGIDVEPEAVARIVQETSGYPYFLQEWRKSAWDVADASPDYTGRCHQMPRSWPSQRWTRASSGSVSIVSRRRRSSIYGRWRILVQARVGRGI